MFSKKCFVAFISKHFIDTGIVVLGSKATFAPGEAFQYTTETLPEVLGKIGTLAKGNIRIVLGEELVYVTELSFPGGEHISREMVLEKAEQSIPEDLRKTDWDFQTLRYTEKPKTGQEVLVQIAVVEKTFSDSFRQALGTNPLPIESVLPESYILAGFEREAEGVSVIVEQDREVVVICAAEGGFVIATRVEEGEMTREGLGAFLGFLSSYKTKKAARIIFSHFDESVLEAFSGLSDEEYEIIAKDYNPLVGAALQQKISGKDEHVLNIDVFSAPKKKSWWRGRQA